MQKLILFLYNNSEHLEIDTICSAICKHSKENKIFRYKSNKDIRDLYAEIDKMRKEEIKQLNKWRNKSCS